MVGFLKDLWFAYLFLCCRVSYVVLMHKYSLIHISTKYVGVAHRFVKYDLHKHSLVHVSAKNMQAVHRVVKYDLNKLSLIHVSTKNIGQCTGL